jgi:hypothetical protein
MSDGICLSAITHGFAADHRLGDALDGGIGRFGWIV